MVMITPPRAWPFPFHTFSKSPSSRADQGRGLYLSYTRRPEGAYVCSAWGSTHGNAAVAACIAIGSPTPIWITGIIGHTASRLVGMNALHRPLRQHPFLWIHPSGSVPPRSTPSGSALRDIPYGSVPLDPAHPISGLPTGIDCPHRPAMAAQCPHSSESCPGSCIFVVLQNHGGYFRVAV